MHRLTHPGLFLVLSLCLPACSITDSDAKFAASRQVREPVTLEHGGFVSIYTLHSDPGRHCLRREREARQALYPGASTSWTPNVRASLEGPIGSSDTFAGYERVVTCLGPSESNGTGGRYTVTSTYCLARPQSNPVTCPVTR